MRIDGTSGIETHGLPDPKAHSGESKRQEKTEIEQLVPDDPQIRYLHQLYKEQAAAAEEIDREAVTEARERLRTGRLDTPEAARRAGEVILNLGP